MSQSTAFLVNEQKLSLATLSFRVDKAELRRLLDFLQERVNGTIELETANQLLQNKTPQDVETFRQAVRDANSFFITLAGTDGSQLNGTVGEIFDSPNFPAEIATVFVDSATKFRNQNYTPRNSLKLFVDFQRPAVFNFNFMPSYATENGSYFTANGVDVTWVRGVYHEVVEFTREHGATAGWLHRHSIYDILLFPIGFPLAFWITYRAGPSIQRVSSPFLQAGLFVYLWFATLWVFRALFHYARWLWPLVEYRRENSKMTVHRVFWSLLLSSLFSSLVYDVIKKTIDWP